MVRGDGYGTNWRGHYSTQLMDFYGRARRARGHDFSDTVKMTVLAGHYMSEQYNRHYYGKAQNIGRRLSRDYDNALQAYDLLIMPTTAMKAVKDLLIKVSIAHLPVRLATFTTRPLLMSVVIQP
ncbi:hypothetical protein HORIV_38310 [Vreelandella olivaria]|uniref:Amidase domain-containing protein n=1 Tax=Vreelandella olivaria TaxID=390919 RepID=A0ABN5X2L0_9GAMM|nr:hypothetical protein HORIV_38310 [Halomonas olivaria]